MFKNFKKKNPILFNPTYLTIVGSIIVIGLLINGILYIQGKEIASAKPSPSVIPLVSPSPEPTEFAYPNPTYKAVIANPTADPDPIIDCQNPNCGSIKIKKSLCSNTSGYICCQVGTVYSWYSSRDKCTQDQNNFISNYYNTPHVTPYNPPANNTYIAPTSTPYKATTKEEADADCRRQTDSTTGSDCQKGQDYSTCMGGYGYSVPFPYCY